MNARKDRLRSLFAGEADEGAPSPSPASEPQAPPKRSSSGAVIACIDAPEGYEVELIQKAK